MKYLIVFILFPLTIWSQTTEVRGWVKNENDEPIQNIELVVLAGEKGTLVSFITDSMGYFHFTTENDPIHLLIDDYSYQTFDKLYSMEEVKVPLFIILNEKTIVLNEVLISNNKPTVKRKIDRLEFNVENSTLSSMNAWEIISNTPLVSVSMDAISIKGSKNIVVTITGKKTLLSGDQLKTFLENTDGGDIKSVEVITNPPANYEASGSSVLNIVMKKNITEGYRGVLTARQQQSQYARNLFSLSQFYKKGRISTMLGYNYSEATFVRKSTDVVFFSEDETMWESRLVRKNVSKNIQQFNSVTEYDIDSLSVITIGIDGYFSPKTIGTYRVPTVIYNKDHEIESSYLTINERDTYYTIINGYAQLDKKFKNSHQLIWTNYFTQQQSKENQDVFTQLNFIHKPYQETRFVSHSGQKTNLFSSDLFYSIKKDKWKWDSGGKLSRVHAELFLDFFNDESGDLQFRPEKSNTFEYDETIIALFTTFDYTLDQWTIKTGLRAENTAVKSTITPDEVTNSNSYFDLFPTIYLMYETPSKQQFTLSYGKRITRPSYSWLNPAKSYYNLFSYFEGDPQLKATISYNYEASYTYKDWLFNLFYTKRKNPSMEISYQIDETKMMVYHYTNIKKNEYVGASINKSFKLTDWSSLKTSLYGHHGQDFFFGPNQKLYKNEIWEYQIGVSTDIQLDKDKDWKVQIGYRYNSPSIQGSFNVGSNSSTYLVMNKKIFDKKLDLSLVASDIFRTQGMKLTTKYGNQNSYFTDYSDSQSIAITVKYNFGNSKITNKKNVEKTTEHNRI